MSEYVEERARIVATMKSLEDERDRINRAIHLLQDSIDALMLDPVRKPKTKTSSGKRKGKKPGPKPKAPKVVTEELESFEEGEARRKGENGGKPTGRLSNDERAVEQFLELDGTSTSDEIAAETGIDQVMPTIAKLIERGRVRQHLPAEMGGQPRYALTE